MGIQTSGLFQTIKGKPSIKPNNSFGLKAGWLGLFSLTKKNILQPDPSLISKTKKDFKDAEFDWNL